MAGSREAAFVYAISSSAVVHAITRACSKGTLRNCSCDPSKIGKGRDKKGHFEWGGCSDNVQYGSDFSRTFIDAREKKVRDARALMNLHNNRAGRRVRPVILGLYSEFRSVTARFRILRGKDLPFFFFLFFVRCLHDTDYKENRPCT